MLSHDCLFANKVSYQQVSQNNLDEIELGETNHYSVR
ncbi:hypothetical protein SAMN05421827_13011 [Pedobacter terrae]|uniref:Uncharacterized protein n=1 Tax=Pedobacter terrae TaxID=405671 RepID=A0A1G8DL21_9SPHI|nr:hypothetical protein SAMN05421827_13011 [Pedobacter terrae]